MRKTLILLSTVALLGLTGCSDGKVAQKAAEDMGFTDVVTGGWTPFGCGKEDAFTTTFTAKNAQGKPVEGVVCSGWFGYATVRTY